MIDLPTRLEAATEGSRALGKPLNGTLTHPLTTHAKSVLNDLYRNGALPTQEINAGVVDRFHREALTETVMRRSPYKMHKGKNIRFEQITDAGRAALRARAG